MAYVKEHPPSEVYHLTKKENLNSILEDGMIRRFSDMECWFCVDLQKMKAYMERTVMCEGKPYYSVAGQLCRYPQFVPEDYVLLMRKDRMVIRRSFQNRQRSSERFTRSTSTVTVLT